jgi:hypothetical protein
VQETQRDLQEQEVGSRILCTICVGLNGGFSITINNTYTEHKCDSSESIETRQGIDGTIQRQKL